MPDFDGAKQRHSSLKHESNSEGRSILQLITSLLPKEFAVKCSPKLSGPSPQETHEYRPPRPTDSRCPCPALNTLANHGYLPRDGNNIRLKNLVEALVDHNTYHLSPSYANFLARGSVLLMRMETLPEFVSISLEHLALHGYIEHNASIVHKDTPEGSKIAPSLTDPALLEDFLRERPSIKLVDIASRRAALERVSPLDALHQEIARGEWALVLDIFGRAHGGEIPSEALRVWLYENRFPDGWQPDHEEMLLDTMKTAKKIREAMSNLGCSCCEGGDAKVEHLLKSKY